MTKLFILFIKQGKKLIHSGLFIYSGYILLVSKDSQQYTE